MYGGWNIPFGERWDRIMYRNFVLDRVLTHWNYRCIFNIYVDVCIYIHVYVQLDNKNNNILKRNRSITITNMV